MTKTRRFIIELLDTFVFAAIFYAVFATTVYWLITDELLSFLQTLCFVALVAANLCMRRICFTNWFNHQKHDVHPIKDARLGGARDIVGQEYKPGETVVTNLGLKLVITHLIIPVAIFAMPFTVMSVAWFILSLVIAGHSVWFSLRKSAPGRMALILTAAIIFIAMSFWMASGGSWFFVSIYTLLLLFVSVGWLIVVHMVKVDDSLKAAESSSQQSVGKIIAFNYKLLAGFALTFSAIVAAVYFALMRPILVAIASFFDRLPVFERGKLTREEYMGPMITGPGQGDGMMEFLQYLGPARTNYAAYLIINILLSAMVIALVLGIGYVVLRGIFHWLNMRATKTNTQEGLPEIEDEKEFIGLSSTRRGKRVKTKKEHALRRLFRETVQKHIKMGVPIKNTDTPTEMTVRVRDRDFDSLADEYSRVRYGGNEA